MYGLNQFSKEVLLVSVTPKKYNDLSGKRIILEKPSVILNLPEPTLKVFDQKWSLKPAKLKGVQNLVSKYVSPDCLSFLFFVNCV